MHDIDVISDPAAARVALEPVRARLLAELAEPGSAATLADKVGLTRQKVNYHLRLLETHGLVREVEQRRWGGLTERLLQASASSYVVSPHALGDAGSDPGRTSDRLSAGYLVALAARIVREVGQLAQRAEAAGKRVPTLAIDAEIRLRSPAERAAFTSEVATALTAIAARYHDPSACDGRSYRLMVGAHPLPRGGGDSVEA
jgi:DNA-binding transcriptional ArsR family regulator